MCHGSTAGAVLPLPLTVLPLREYRPEQAAVVEPDRAAVPRKRYYRSSTALLPLEGNVVTETCTEEKPQVVVEAVVGAVVPL